MGWCGWWQIPSWTPSSQELLTRNCGTGTIKGMLTLTASENGHLLDLPCSWKENIGRRFSSTLSHGKFHLKPNIPFLCLLLWERYEDTVTEDSLLLCVAGRVIHLTQRLKVATLRTSNYFCTM